VPHNRRSSTRHDVDLPASAEVGGESLAVVLKNLSLGGALIAWEGQLDLGTRLDLSFRIPNMEDPIKVGCAVRWVGGGAIGVQFDGLRAREVWSLNKYFEGLDAP
jgi:hypothetical protein